MLKRCPELSGFQLRFLLLGYSCPEAAMFAEPQLRGTAQHSRLEHSLRPSSLAGDISTLEHSSQRFRGTNPVELTHRKNRNARL